mmetsp:Transcript_73901/g.186237  ORF Transcript_73901/g.186237 Transcript_73901/m.186237 type:complete len:248 (-) Transcript_73901:456-1199(-)
MNALFLGVLELQAPRFLGLRQVLRRPAADQRAALHPAQRAKEAVKHRGGGDVWVVHDILGLTCAGAAPQEQQRFVGGVVERPHVDPLVVMLIPTGRLEHAVGGLPRQTSVQEQPSQLQPLAGCRAQGLFTSLLHAPQAAPAALAIQRDDALVEGASLPVGLLEAPNVGGERPEDAGLAGAGDTQQAVKEALQAALLLGGPLLERDLLLLQLPPRLCSEALPPSAPWPTAHRLWRRRLLPAQVGEQAT